MGLEDCTSCNVVVHCLLTRIVGWNNTKLSSVEVFGNGTLMVAWGAVDAFWASAGTTFHVAGVPEVFIFQALYHIDPTSKINYLFLGHF